MGRKSPSFLKERRSGTDRRKINNTDYSGLERRSGRDRRIGAVRRKHIRITYPLGCRPKLTILNKEYDVIDIAEHGIKFTCSKKQEFQQGSEVKISITFKDNESFDLKGTILRADKKIVILYLPEGISFERIIAEQRYLKSNMPEYL
jgi:hypothetical protein